MTFQLPVFDDAWKEECLGCKHVLRTRTLHGWKWQCTAVPAQAFGAARAEARALRQRRVFAYCIDARFSEAHCGRSAKLREETSGA